MVVRTTQEEVRPGKGAKDENLFKEMDQATKKRSCMSCGGCALVLGVGLIGLALVTASTVAATGIVRIPVLSTLFYRTQPVPVRTVVPDGPTELGSLLESKLKDPQVIKTQRITVTEAELTQLLRDPGQDGQVVIKQGQLAIDSGEAELYGQVTLFGDSPVTMRANIVPDSSGQGLTVSSLALGNVTMPKIITDTALNYAIAAVTSQLRLEPTTNLADLGIESVQLQPGVLDIVVSPDLFEALEAGAGATNELPNQAELEAVAQ